MNFVIATNFQNVKIFCNYITFPIADVALKIYGINFVPRSDLNELQQLEQKRSQLRAQLAEGRNWVENFDQKREELKKIDEEIRVYETIAANAETIKEDE